jgi:hypothetical protein
MTECSLHTSSAPVFHADAVLHRQSVIDSMMVQMNHYMLKREHDAFYKAFASALDRPGAHADVFLPYSSASRVQNTGPHLPAELDEDGGIARWRELRHSFLHPLTSLRIREKADFLLATGCVPKFFGCPASISPCVREDEIWLLAMPPRMKPGDLFPDTSLEEVHGIVIEDAPWSIGARMRKDIPTQTVEGSGKYRLGINERYVQRIKLVA